MQWQFNCPSRRGGGHPPVDGQSVALVEAHLGRQVPIESGGGADGERWRGTAYAESPVVAKYSGVPQTVHVRPPASSRLAKPKSTSLRYPEASSSRFSGLRSR